MRRKDKANIVKIGLYSLFLVRCISLYFLHVGPLDGTGVGHLMVMG